MKALIMHAFRDAYAGPLVSLPPIGSLVQFIFHRAKLTGNITVICGFVFFSVDLHFL
jgi:hypothetical protein